MITTFTIATTTGSVQVKGVTYGCLGITIPHFIGGFASGYSITHLPTGRQIAGYSDRTNAIECMKHLADLDWQQMNTQDFIEELTEIVCEFYCCDYPPLHMVEVLNQFNSEVHA